MTNQVVIPLSYISSSGEAETALDISKMVVLTGALGPDATTVVVGLSPTPPMSDIRFARYLEYLKNKGWKQNIISKFSAAYKALEVKVKPSFYKGRLGIVIESVDAAAPTGYNVDDRSQYFTGDYHARLDARFRELAMSLVNPLASTAFAALVKGCRSTNKIHMFKNLPNTIDVDPIDWPQAGYLAVRIQYDPMATKCWNYSIPSDLPYDALDIFWKSPTELIFDFSQVASPWTSENPGDLQEQFQLVYTVDPTNLSVSPNTDGLAYPTYRRIYSLDKPTFYDASILESHGVSAIKYSPEWIALLRTFLNAKACRTSGTRKPQHFRGVNLHYKDSPSVAAETHFTEERFQALAAKHVSKEAITAEEAAMVWDWMHFNRYTLNDVFETKMWLIPNSEYLREMRIYGEVASSGEVSFSTMQARLSSLVLRDSLAILKEDERFNKLSATSKNRIVKAEQALDSDDALLVTVYDKPVPVTFDPKKLSFAKTFNTDENLLNFVYDKSVNRKIADAVNYTNKIKEMRVFSSVVKDGVDWGALSFYNGIFRPVMENIGTILDYDVAYGRVSSGGYIYDLTQIEGEPWWIDQPSGKVPVFTLSKGTERLFATTELTAYLVLGMPNVVPKIGSEMKLACILDPAYKDKTTNEKFYFAYEKIKADLHDLGINYIEPVDKRKASTNRVLIDCPTWTLDSGMLNPRMMQFSNMSGRRADTMLLVADRNYSALHDSLQTSVVCGSQRRIRDANIEQTLTADINAMVQEIKQVFKTV